MTKLSSPRDETQDPSPTIRNSVTTLGRVLSSFGGDDDDIDAYMNAIADELEAKRALLQVSAWSSARLWQELRAFEPAGAPDTICAKLRYAVREGHPPVSLLPGCGQSQ